MSVRSSTGLKGVSIHKATNKFQANYYRAGVTYLCGYFDDPEIASTYRDKFISVLESNWIQYLSTVSKSCVQNFVRFIIDNPSTFEVNDKDAIHDIKVRIIKEFDTPEDVKAAEIAFNRARRERVQANNANPN